MSEDVSLLEKRLFDLEQRFGTRQLAKPVTHCIVELLTMIVDLKRQISELEERIGGSDEIKGSIKTLKDYGSIFIEDGP